MGGMNTLGNILWLILGGLELAVAWAIIGIVLCITIVGIPFGIQHLKLALISLAPIGQMIVTNHEAESGRYIR